MVTTGGTLYVRAMNQSSEQQRFLLAIQDTKAKINRRIETYVNMLQGGSGLFAASKSVTRGEFRAYVDRLELPKYYPGIQGIGFSQRVKASDKNALVEQARSQGITTTISGEVQPFYLWPDTPRDEYHTILYLEPLDRRNHAAIGYNMFTEPTRAEAMAIARDTGSAAVSGRVHLVQEIDEDVQAGFLIYVPVYYAAVIPPTVQERREKLLGFVYSPFRVGDLLEGTFADNKRSLLDYAIYEGTAPSDDLLLYSTQSHARHRPSRRQRTMTVTLLSEDRAWKGRPWTIVFTARPELASVSSSVLLWVVPVAGLLISGVLFFLTRTQATMLADRQRAAEERLQLLSREQEARREAEQANRLKDEFLATVSHELRTPLSAILGWAQLLHSGKADAALLAQGLDAIERNSKTQSQLIDDLLDVSRIISGRLRLSTDRIDLISAIEAALDTVRPAARAKDIQLNQVFDPAAGTIMGDATRLQQVTWNLLSNAIKFTPRGGHVEVRLQRVGDSHIELVVRDDGQGIEPDFLPYVFDRFRQADGSTTRRHSGLGLGLAIARHLVELHGGTTHAYSEGLGKGSTFTIRLPVREPNHIADVQKEAQAIIQTAPWSPSQLTLLDDIRVLVVDDQPDARQLMQTIFTQAHAQVIAADSVQQAIAALRNFKPHVLVSDISMPGEDGYALIQQIRQLPQANQIPAIALTAFARTEDHRRVLQAGFQMHIAKPVEASYITAVIAKLAHRTVEGRAPTVSQPT